jgi:hypothetical protein
MDKELATALLNDWREFCDDIDTNPNSDETTSSGRKLSVKRQKDFSSFMDWLEKKYNA